MIIIDKALEKRHRENNPIRVGMVGAGFMARGIALQLLGPIKGIELVAIANRNIDAAKFAYKQAGADNVSEVSSVSDLEKNMADGKFSVTDDVTILCKARGVDVVLEVTGAIEHGASLALEAITNRKHVVLMNAELDGTIGPILKKMADEAGVVITNVDGDQPGVIMNLYRFVKGIGVKPVLCGNIKGLQDPYRNPTTQEGFAKKWGQKAHMVTSFADGSKISFEQAIVANATGMEVGQRGMYGPTVSSGTHIHDVIKLYPGDALLSGPGIVDYVVGAEPGPGVFVLGTHDNPLQQHYLNLYKLGEGPLYCFYTPYHLCHFEVHNTIVRAVDFQDAAITPIGKPMVDVVATAKIDLAAGTVLDGIGYYMTYGQCENASVAIKDRLLPMGLAEGCKLKSAIQKDQVLTFDDVELPSGRLVDKLRNEQDSLFFK